MEHARLIRLTGSPFGNARELRSELGFFVFFAYRESNPNIIHYGSTGNRLVKRLVMAIELHSLTYGFDNCFIIRDLLWDISRKLYPIEASIDYKTVLDFVAKQNRAAEKRFQIDGNALRQSYSNGELPKLAWVPGKITQRMSWQRLGAWKPHNRWPLWVRLRFPRTQSDGRRYRTSRMTTQLVDPGKEPERRSMWAKPILMTITAYSNARTVNWVRRSLGKIRHPSRAMEAIK